MPLTKHPKKLRGERYTSDDLFAEIDEQSARIDEIIDGLVQYPELHRLEQGIHNLYGLYHSGVIDFRKKLHEPKFWKIFKDSGGRKMDFHDELKPQLWCQPDYYIWALAKKLMPPNCEYPYLWQNAHEKVALKARELFPFVEIEHDYCKPWTSFRLKEDSPQ